MVLKTKTYDVGSSSGSDVSDVSMSEDEAKPTKPEKEMVFEIEEDDSEENNEEQGEGEWQVQGESGSNSENSDDESQESESSDEGDDKPMPMPESLSRIFESKAILIDYTMSEAERQNVGLSIFNKVTRAGVDTGMTSENIQENRLKKAEDLYKKQSIFKDIAINQKSIKPLLCEKLDQKERKKKQEETTGRAWGHMKKVELTEEVKADLRAIKLRNQIFAKNHYKGNDYKKLPEYFQIGTVVDDSTYKGGNKDRLTKKQRKGTIAEQFLMDDQDNGFSKRKYESINEKKRRMGDKKQKIKVNKKRVTDQKRISGKSRIIKKK